MAPPGRDRAAPAPDMSRKKLGGEEQAVAGAVGNKQVWPAGGGAGYKLQRSLLAHFQ